jgi:xanthine dehydrogenase YagR molybdenum-binding subunit
MKACDAVMARLNEAGHNSETVGAGTNGDLAGKFNRLGVSTVEEYAEFIPPDAKPNPLAKLLDDPIKKLYNGTPTLVGGSHSEKLLYAMGAEMVEVRIHALTREIRVPRIVGAFAGGRIMNTLTARSQYMGAMIWGISSALHEATEIDPRVARYTNDNLADYLIPVNADIQQLEVILVPETDNNVNAPGVKGIGELGNVGTAAAIANAVYHATGVRVRELPIRLEKILNA